MKRQMMAMLAILMLAIPVFAQDDRGEGRRGRGGRGGRGGGMERMFERAADDLKLDDDQRAQFDQMVARHQERTQEFRALREEAREARENGDEQRLAELRDQMREEAGPWDSASQVFDELEPILSEEQFDRFVEMRSEMQQRQERRREMRERREQYRDMVSELPAELKMTDEQRKQFDELVEGRRERMRERMRGMRPTWDQMREARDAGDEQRVEQLRQQFEKMRPDEAAMRGEFLDDVNKMLTDQQKPRFASYRAKIEKRTTSAATIERDDVRVVLMAAKKLDLKPDQQRELRVIWREATRSMRDMGRSDSEARSGLAASTKQKVLNLLDPGQVEEYERHVDRLKHRKNR